MSHYVGSKAIPHKVGEHIETRVSVVLPDGGKIPVCDESLAQTYQQTYAAKGIATTIQVDQVTINDFEIW